MSDQHILPCQCAGTCGVAIVTEWEAFGDDPAAFGVSFYQHVGSGGLHGSAIDLTLHPKPVRVTVTWGDTSCACPGQVVLPYFITLYNPSDGGTPTDEVDETQASCSAGTATFVNSVKPGSYVVDLDSRAISPMVKSTKPISVVAGEDLTVSMF